MRNLFCILFLGSFVLLNGQYKAPKFGKIDINELTMTKYDNDTLADALMLFDEGVSRFTLNRDRNFQFEYERHCRIKIFKKSAYQYANFSIILFENGSKREVLDKLKGATFNLVNDKIVKTKLDNDNVFIEKGKKFVIKKFAFPEVKEGSVIEISYSITSDFLYNFRGWIFQRDYPALWSQYTYIIPEYFNYRQSSKGYLPFDINISEAGTETYTVHYDSEITPGINGGRTPSENYDLKAAVTIKTIGIKDVPAFKSEPNIDCEDNYIQSLEFELASVQFPHEMRKDYTQSWESVNEQMNDDVDFGKLLNSSGFINDTVTNICSNLSSKEEKAIAIYNYVQNRMKWNENYSIWALRGLKKPFVERIGNSAEINLLLTLLLKTAGLNAFPIIFSTRENGNPITFYPTISKYNSVLTKVEIDGKTFLLDATSKYCPFGLLPANDINGQGRVVNNSNGDWVDLNSNEKYKEAKIYNLNITEDGKFTGSVTGSYTGYAAVEYRNMLSHEKNTNEYIRKLQENIKGLTINKYVISDFQNNTKPVSDTMYVEISDHSDLIGDKILFYPLLFECIKKNKYTLEERKYPVDYNFPISETYIFDYTLPAGYQIESLPKASTIKLPDNSISISYIVQSSENKIKLVYRRNINKRLFLPEEYANLKEIYNQIVKKHDEQIILKKITTL
jgi:hypothetical protein